MKSIDYQCIYLLLILQYTFRIKTLLIKNNFVKERELEMNKYNYKIEKITFTNLCLNNKFKLIHKLAFYVFYENSKVGLP